MSTRIRIGLGVRGYRRVLPALPGGRLHRPSQGQVMPTSLDDNQRSAEEAPLPSFGAPSNRFVGEGNRS